MSLPCRLEEEDYRGERYANHHKELKGNNDLLVITKPQVGSCRAFWALHALLRWAAPCGKACTSKQLSWVHHIVEQSTVSPVSGD
jgi:hypothetical protein